MKRILVVDDEIPAARLLKAALEQTGRYDVRVVNEPEDALEAAREFRPHLVLMDIIMPRVPGGDVAQSIRSDHELKDTPIVFLTAAIQRWVVREHAGVIAGDPFIAKPADLKEIIRVIETYSSPAIPAPTPGPAQPTPLNLNLNPL
jgi:CheY-like chemotaxis protein